MIRDHILEGDDKTLHIKLVGRIEGRKYKNGSVGIYIYIFIIDFRYNMI